MADEAGALDRCPIHSAPGAEHPGAGEPSRAAAPRSPVRAKGLPLVGHFPALLRDPIGTLARIVHHHRGDVVSVPLGPAKLLMPTTPRQVAHMCYDHWRKYPKGGGGFYKVVRRVYGESLVTLDGDAWLADRRLLQPIFSQRNLDAMTGEMAASLERTLAELAARAAAGAPLAINREMKTLTLNTATRTLFGMSLSGEESTRLATLAVDIFNVMLRRMFWFFLPSVLPLPSELALRRGLRQLDDALLAQLRLRQEEASPRFDLMSLLLNTRDDRTGEPLSLRHVRDELVTFFFASHETTSMTLGWALYLLGRHPEVLDRLTAEVDAVLAGGPPTVERLAALTYTRQVVQETLRLYPPAWIIPRTCEEGDEIDGFAIPARSIVALNVFALHRDPALWERPEAFVPERFAGNPTRPRGMYFPFGGGPRVCIGDQFSLVEAQLALAMFVQRFRPRLVDAEPVGMRGLGAALKPSRDIRMVCVPRS